MVVIDCGKTLEMEWDGNTADLYINPRGVLEEIDGVEKLKQDIMIEFITIQTTDKLHPYFGFPYFDIIGFPLKEQLIELEIENILNNNKNIRSIDSIIISTDDNETYSIDIEVTTISADIISLEMSV